MSPFFKFVFSKTVTPAALCSRPSEVLLAESPLYVNIPVVAHSEIRQQGQLLFVEKFTLPLFDGFFPELADIS